MIFRSSRQVMGVVKPILENKRDFAVNLSPAIRAGRRLRRRHHQQAERWRDQSIVVVRRAFQLFIRIIHVKYSLVTVIMKKAGTCKFAVGNWWGGGRKMLLEESCQRKRVRLRDVVSGQDAKLEGRRWGRDGWISSWEVVRAPISELFWWVEHLFSFPLSPISIIFRINNKFLFVINKLILALLWNLGHLKKFDKFSSFHSFINLSVCS